MRLCFVTNYSQQKRAVQRLREASDYAWQWVKAFLDVPNSLKSWIFLLVSCSVECLCTTNTVCHTVCREWQIHKTIVLNQYTSGFAIESNLFANKPVSRRSKANPGHNVQLNGELNGKRAKVMKSTWINNNDTVAYMANWLQLLFIWSTNWI